MIERTRTEREMQVCSFCPCSNYGSAQFMNNQSRTKFRFKPSCFGRHNITGIGNIAFECSFTVPKGGSVKEAEEVIATLEIRKEGEKYPAELIPVRLSEIYQINESYEWVVSTVKEELKKDFQGVEDDLEKLQQVIDSGKIGPKKKDEWLAIGITVCTILANEVEGMEWKTLIDGNREAPVLDYKDRIIDPMKIAWSKVKAGQPCNVIEEYKSLIINY